MKLAVSLAACMLLSSSFLNAAPKEPDVNISKKTAHQLPEAPKATVISLNYRGGFGPPRIDYFPTLSVLADGTVVMPATHANRRAMKEKITKDQLQELLRFVIDEQRLLEVSNESIAKQIQKERDAQAAKMGGLIAIARIADAATVEIFVNVDGKQHEVRHYPSGWNEHKIDHLVRFHTVRQHLQKFMSITQLGGKQEVAKWLAVVNKELKAKYPKVKPFAMADFQSGGKAADGRVYVGFNRSKQNKDGQTIEYTFGRVNQSAGGEAKIIVNHRDNIQIRKRFSKKLGKLG